MNSRKSHRKQHAQPRGTGTTGKRNSKRARNSRVGRQRDEKHQLLAMSPMMTMLVREVDLVAVHLATAHELLRNLRRVYDSKSGKPHGRERELSTTVTAGMF